MSINRLYHTWFRQVGQLWPDLRVTRQRNFTWLLIGIYLSKSVHLNEIALKIPGRAKLVSLTRRLSRFLSDSGLCVRKRYNPIAVPLLEMQAKTGEIRLVLDTTRVGFHQRLLMVALAYRKRTVPIAWTWVKHVKGHSRARVQVALLAHVQRWIPEGATVSVVGDCEFGAIELIRQLDTWKWNYVLRQESRNMVVLTLGDEWQRFGDLVARPGQSVWLGRRCLTKRHIYPVNLLAHWKRGYDEPWLLATSYPDRIATLRAYKRRMWIEEMFGDMKGHGFDLESTHLRHLLRLSRLTLVVALLYIWLLFAGARAIKNGQRHLVDRIDRRDLSLFQIGWRIIDRRLINDLPFSIRLCLTVHPKLSGS